MMDNVPVGRGAVAGGVLLLALCAAADGSGSAERGLKNADTGMAAAVAARDPGRFRACLDPDAAFAGEGGVSRGPDAVVESWARLLAPGGPTLAWHPDRAHAAGSGDLGFTEGRYLWEFGKERAEGRYVTVWRRRGASGWRALFDHSLERGPPAGAVRVPASAARSRDGSLEAEVGSWSSRADSRAGTYLIVRRRGADGAWLVMVDSGAVQTSR